VDSVVLAQALAWSLAFAILAWAARDLPWYKLRGDAEAWRVLLLTALALAALRWFNTDAVRGVQLHFLGATLATLMFGPRFALWTMAAAVLGAWAMGATWHGWAADFLTGGALAVLVTEAVGRGIERRLPPNLLIYVWVRGFLGGALAIAAVNLARAAFVALAGEPGAAGYLIAIPPMMFGEGFLCGGAIALIVVYRPQWCATFDDRRYLGPPPGRDSGSPPE
jgi:uncharacterized membrane protein